MNFIFQSNTHNMAISIQGPIMLQRSSWFALNSALEQRFCSNVSLKILKNMHQQLYSSEILTQNVNHELFFFSDLLNTLKVKSSN